MNRGTVDTEEATSPGAADNLSIQFINAASNKVYHDIAIQSEFGHSEMRPIHSPWANLFPFA
jgi:hypothetical protein